MLVQSVNLILEHEYFVDGLIEKLKSGIDMYFNI